MRKLSPAAYQQARKFIQAQARPLDRALFEYRFERGTLERVTVELAKFRNEDGGFGHALEPDLRTPSSSALATGIALQILKMLHCPPGHPLVQDAVTYLLDTYDDKQQVWRPVPGDTHAYPHAIWWHDEAGSLAQTFDGFRIIPRAEIVGLLNDYAILVPMDWLAALSERTVDYIASVENLGTGGGDDLVAAISLAGSEQLPASLRERVIARLRAVVPQVVSRDPTEWNTYCIPPLKLAPAPDSPFADLLGPELNTHLDYTILHQSHEGTWDPVWSWADRYPQAWEQARQEWRGQLTLNTLTTLRAFGRIA
jgi:hypothetical protein